MSKMATSIEVLADSTNLTSLMSQESSGEKQISSSWGGLTRAALIVAAASFMSMSVKDSSFLRACASSGEFSSKNGIKARIAKRISSTF
jgi:hypothetical protein